MFQYYAVGVMSGTSLDGLDLCLCGFDLIQKSFGILKAATVKYPAQMESDLRQMDMSAVKLSGLDFELGRFIGKAVKDFVADFDKPIAFVASHGHTIFHNPGTDGYTTQIGSGSAIAVVCGLTCINDFRSADVVRGGQGAPLVPLGDRDLFGQYSSCVNLGGFANISFGEDVRKAYDICPVNYVLNHYTSHLGLSFDSGGQIAAAGKCNTVMLEKLDAIPFYDQDGPKSLGAEWVIRNIFPLIESFNDRPENVLTTFCHHAANQIGRVLPPGEALFTGGGVYNEFLINLIRNTTRTKLVIPDPQIVEFKEALVFAWLGLKRYVNEVNILASVTGAKADSIGGSVHLP